MATIRRLQFVAVSSQGLDVDHLRSALLGGLCALVVSTSQAQDDGTSASVLIDCGYEKHGSAEIESTTVIAGDNAEFQIGKKSDQSLKVAVPGDYAECLYPSGHSVRVKVGVGIARPYGWCGGDPGVFLSLWVNKRKVASSVTFAGHCLEHGGIRYSIAEDSIEKCSMTPNDDGADESASTICTRFTVAEKFPVDELEYPTGPHAAAGSIQIQSGDDAICRAAQAELTSRWDAFFDSGRPLSFDQPTFHDASAALPELLVGSRESKFDFDNDGVPDRVFHKEYMGNYMHGSTLFIDPEMNASEVTGGWFLPCQIDAGDTPLSQCPPFPRAKNEVGFSMDNPGAESVHFRARYSHLLPFRHEQTTYLAVSSESGDTRDFVAILKPLPKRSFEHMCLLRKVPENF